MKFDILKWQEIKPNELYENDKGRLQVLCSESACLYIEAHGVEVLAGVGQKIDIQTAETVKFRLEAPETCRVFIYAPHAQYTVVTGEVFTNLDRKPDESGTVRIVQQALRELRLREQSFRREVEQQSRDQRKLTEDKPEKKEDKHPEPDPEPEKVEENTETKKTKTDEK